MEKTCEIKEIANSKHTSLYDFYFFLIENLSNNWQNFRNQGDPQF